MSPVTAVTEFLLGHPRDAARADRVLNVIAQLDVTAAIARRAAWLLGRAARGLERAPSVTDGTVAAFGEIYGAVVTNDVGDLGALSAAGTGFDIYSIAELLAAIEHEPS